MFVNRSIENTVTVREVIDLLADLAGIVFPLLPFLFRSRPLKKI